MVMTNERNWLSESVGKIIKSFPKKFSGIWLEKVVKFDFFRSLSLLFTCPVNSSALIKCPRDCFHVCTMQEISTQCCRQVWWMKISQLNSCPCIFISYTKKCLFAPLQSSLSTIDFQAGRELFHDNDEMTEISQLLCEIIYGFLWPFDNRETFLSQSWKSIAGFFYFSSARFSVVSTFHCCWASMLSGLFYNTMASIKIKENDDERRNKKRKNTKSAKWLWVKKLCRWEEEK